MNKLENYIGKEVYKCSNIGGRLNLDEKGYSFCHFFEVGTQKIDLDKDITPELYKDAVVKKIEENFCESALCRKCSRCNKTNFEEQKITFVAIGISKYCNSNCVYCPGTRGEKGEGANPLIDITRFHEAGMFSENCLFDWGGGEPTLGPYFEESIKYLFEAGYPQRINTNAILFSEEAYNALKGGKCTLRVSVDSGTKEVFRKVKGTDKYDDVWENIKKYASVSDKVYIKYNIFHWNSDLVEADAFLDNCVKCNIKHVYVESEHNAYGKIGNVGPFFFGEKELDFAKYLFEEAKKRGIEALVASGFNDRNAENNFVIPEKLISNIDHESIKNGIVPDTFATVGYLVDYIKKQNEPVIIWGAREFGKIVKQRLERDNIEIAAFIERDERLQNTFVKGTLVISPEEAASKFSKSIVILAANRYESMVATINEKNWVNWKGKIYYLYLPKYK